jgi:hypothetical protein
MPTLQEIRELPYPQNHVEESNIIRLAERTFRLSKDHWEELNLPVALDWEMYRFEANSRPHIPNNRKGVYSFVIQPGIANHPSCSYLIYVGMVEKGERSFRVRFNEYLRDEIGLKTRRLSIHDVLSRWSGYIWFCFASINDETVIADVEEHLLDAYIPPYNKQFRGAIGGAMHVLGGT